MCHIKESLVPNHPDDIILTYDEQDFVEHVDTHIRLSPTFGASYSFSEPFLNTQGDLNNFIRNLNLSKRKDVLCVFR